MREILFRGKRIGNSEWVYGYYVPVCFGRFPCKPAIVPESDGTWEPIEVKKETVGQYTGLTDKNGKKIFEGDILHVKQCGETGVGTCAIYFGEYIDADNDFEDYRCIGFYLKMVDECFSIGVLLDSDFEFEVIGNIHDNPELLEEKE